mmetsp:Transcript_1693/g.6096  ORF Transcript_1693/g.6096 Transcript_1693/m.6096 type:complete len:259 (+) Transcript_1693:2342-3118(+)
MANLSNEERFSCHDHSQISPLAMRLSSFFFAESNNACCFCSSRRFFCASRRFSSSACSGINFCQKSGSSKSTFIFSEASEANVAVANKEDFSFFLSDGRFSFSSSSASTTFCSEFCKIESISSEPHFWYLFSASSRASVRSPYAPCLSKFSTSCLCSFADFAEGLCCCCCCCCCCSAAFSLSLSLLLISPKMACSKPSFMDARVNISFSYVPLETKRYTWTAFVWPILCALANACASFCGFQSESNTMTVSALVKLMP